MATAYAIIGIIVVLGVANGLPLGTGVENPLYLFLGRFHPLVVHIPIALLLVAVIFEGLALCPWFRYLRASMTLLLVIASAGGGLAVVHGTLLAAGGGDSGDALLGHWRSGTALAVLAFLLVPLRVLASGYKRRWLRAGYGICLLAAFLLMVVSSHLGGNITHGPDYLVKYMPPSLRAKLAGMPGPVREFLGLEAAPAVAAAPTTLFDALIAPAFEARCVSCHGPAKAKGGLRMDNLAALMKGGESGPAIVPGNLEKSEALARVLLPVDDDDFMPPDGKTPLSAAQVDVLRWWIASGLPGDTPVEKIENPPAMVQEQLKAFLDARAHVSTSVSATDAQAAHAAEQAELARTLAAINAKIPGKVLPVSGDAADGLALICAGESGAFDDKALDEVLAVAARLRDVDLSRTGVTDAAIGRLAAATNLWKLRLDHCSVGSQGMAPLAALVHLESLNLYGCKAVDDRAVETLARMKGLRKLYLGGTGITSAGLARLRTALPGCAVYGDSEASPEG